MISDSIALNRNDIANNEPIVLKLRDDIGDTSSFASKKLYNTNPLFYHGSTSSSVNSRIISKYRCKCCNFYKIKINKLKYIIIMKIHLMKLLQIH